MEPEAAPNDKRDPAYWLAGRELIVASHRGPLEHHVGDDGVVTACQGSGGLMCALESLAHSLPFTWVASAMTDGDRLVAQRGPVHIEQPARMTVQYVAAAEKVYDAHYCVFSNRVLWFLQHGLSHKLVSALEHREICDAWTNGYRAMNLAFARTLAHAARTPNPVILVQDYHLYETAREVRSSLPGATVLHFSHIPWPDPEAWRVVPENIRRSLLQGLLGADIAGFQDDASADSFLYACREYLRDAWVDFASRRVRHRLGETAVRTYPISVDPAELKAEFRNPMMREYQGKLAPRRDELTLVRVDRLDPIKNIPMGFRAFGQLLDRRPDLVGRVRFLAFMVPSRSSVPEYQREYADAMAAVAGVNARFGRDGYEPIQVVFENNRLQALAGMSLADAVLVNSVADGMNLVAKEAPIVSERDSVLVLSRRCGAWGELGGPALGVDPCSLESTVSALETALSMSRGERAVRAAELRRRIEGYDILDWMGEQCRDIAEVVPQRASARIALPA